MADGSDLTIMIVERGKGSGWQLIMGAGKFLSNDGMFQGLQLAHDQWGLEGKLESPVVRMLHM